MISVEEVPTRENNRGTDDGCSFAAALISDSPRKQSTTATVGVLCLGSLLKLDRPEETNFPDLSSWAVVFVLVILQLGIVLGVVELVCDDIDRWGGCFTYSPMDFLFRATVLHIAWLGRSL